MKFWFRIPLWQRVIGALVLGVAAGLAWGPEAESIKWIGDLFIKAIKMLVVPLIFFSLVSGVGAIGDLRKLGSVGGRALLLFLVTGLIAVSLGLALGALIQPGAGLDLARDVAASTQDSAPPSVTDMILAMVPDNPVSAMANGEVLQLIVFSLLFGIGIVMAGEAGAPIQRAVDAGATIMQHVTMIVMELTPFGVFALIAWVAGTYGIDALLPLGKLVLTNYAGCLILILVVYTVIVKGIAKLPVGDFFRGIIDAQAVAYSTASSSATLPVTLRCAQRNLGVSRSVSGFVTSLGATVNMDGTAMYLGLATMFGAQIFGVDLSFTDYLLVALTATLGSVGAAGIPGAGLIMMTLVFGTVGVPMETIAFVAGIDRIMDMMRTATNVTGDLTVTTAVARMTGEIDVEEYESADDI
ncbi:dicarboxylate/amino acid:cation symporter [Stakelama tenebrarum]|uniref:Dicarboxylate/amino acid:cation symporter n=1 Tax=Stakelama tenebrarum TaxID=2711215 RepID=A0A6G6Y523_9SPHN|nr:dicarboxylate/amino acid:cation symporter [Sphingosinithalassobacter tenebrarum]QIG80032.1 dicarboxylate/amino acid:cation symporter [Sphingosinithalassobacter tenebrarum]